MSNILLTGATGFIGSNILKDIKLNNNVFIIQRLESKKKIKPTKNIKIINAAYKNGYNIILYTARYMGRCKGNLKKVKKQIKPLTLKQLKDWKVKYHELIFGKPSFDLYIDDKSLFYSKNWAVKLKKLFF